MNWKSTVLQGSALAIVYVLIKLFQQQGLLLAYQIQILSLCCINIILVVSLNLINGFTGQFSIGHAGFLAIGAYSSAYLTVNFQAPFFLALLVGAILAGIAGIIVGLPALRLKGDYLAIATLGFGEIIRVVILNTPALGGAKGLAGIPAYTSFDLVYFMAILTTAIITNFIKSDFGRACQAIREDEIAAQSLGIHSIYFKTLAFSISAAFAGLAGGLFSHFLQYMAPTPGQIGFVKSIDILIMVVLGGLGSIPGSIAAALILTIIPEVLRGFAEYRIIIYSLLLIISMIYRPEGLFGGQEFSLATWKQRWEKLKGAITYANK